MIQYLVLLFLLWGLSSCKDTPPIVPPPAPLDTTSHQIVWRTELIGYGAASFFDIAIINENNIWAVGQFYLKDSSSNLDPMMYNVAHWNGHEWVPKRVYTSYDGSRYFGQIRSIFAFDSTDIWIASSGPAHLTQNGDFEILPQSVGKGISPVWKFWGTSSKDLFMVAMGGKLTHFDGTDFPVSLPQCFGHKPV